MATVSAVGLKFDFTCNRALKKPIKMFNFLRDNQAVKMEKDEDFNDHKKLS